MYFLEEGSCTLTSAHPMKGILVSLAAIQSSPTLGNSDMFLTAVPGSFSSNIPLVIMDTWAPVSKRAVTSISFNRHLTVHFFPSDSSFYRFPYLHMIRPLLLLTTWGAVPYHLELVAASKWNLSFYLDAAVTSVGRLRGVYYFWSLVNSRFPFNGFCLVDSP